LREHAEAARVARHTGAVLLALREHAACHGPARSAHETALARDDLRRAADREAHEAIVAELSAAFPGDAILSEEGVDDPRRLTADRVWIVDPLDGTREYGLEGRTDWAVHIALWSRDRGLVAGAVGLPALGLVLATPDVPAPPPPEGRPMRIVVSRSRPPREAHLVARALGAELVALGSAGAKAMAVVRGEADAYVHAGGMHEWDSAAPVVVAAAAGLHTSRIDGRPLVYNRAGAWLPDLVVCRPELAARVLDAANA
jgi:3'(2'), 5'-bisphosphate nucleotidase